MLFNTPMPTFFKTAIDFLATYGFKIAKKSVKHKELITESLK